MERPQRSEVADGFDSSAWHMGQISGWRAKACRDAGEGDLRGRQGDGGERKEPGEEKAGRGNALKGSIFVRGAKNNYGNAIGGKPRAEAGQKR